MHAQLPHLLLGGGGGVGGGGGGHEELAPPASPARVAADARAKVSFSQPQQSQRPVARLLFGVPSMSRFSFVSISCVCAVGCICCAQLQVDTRNWIEAIRLGGRSSASAKLDLLKATLGQPELVAIVPDSLEEVAKLCSLEDFKYLHEGLQKKHQRLITAAHNSAAVQEARRAGQEWWHAIWSAVHPEEGTQQQQQQQRRQSRATRTAAAATGAVPPVPENGAIPRNNTPKKRAAASTAGPASKQRKQRKQ